MRALNIAATGMAAQNMRVEVISHNLANMSTTAYNARRAEFSDLHYQQVERPGTINSADGTVLPAGVQLGLGVRAAAVSMQVAQGTVTETGGSLDLAIEGMGYLEVTLPNGDLDVYVFNTAQAKVNGTLDRLQQAIFSKPQTPWGWKHVVDNMPMAQAPQQPAAKSQTK